MSGNFYFNDPQKYHFCSPCNQYGQPLKNKPNIPGNMIVIGISESIVLRFRIKDQKLDQHLNDLSGICYTYHELFNLPIDCLENAEVGIKISEGNYTGPKWDPGLPWVDPKIKKKNAFYHLVRYMSRPLGPSLENIVRYMVKGGAMRPQYATQFGLGVTQFQYPGLEKGARLPDVHVGIPQASLGEPEG